MTGYESSRRDSETNTHSSDEEVDEQQRECGLSNSEIECVVRILRAAGISIPTSDCSKHGQEGDQACLEDFGDGEGMCLGRLGL